MDNDGIHVRFISLKYVLLKMAQCYKILEIFPGYTADSRSAAEGT